MKKEDIEHQIINRENDLYEFIKNKIKENIQLFLQWKLHLNLMEIISENEKIKLQEYGIPDVWKIIKNLAPLMSSYTRHNPLNSLFNDFDCVSQIQYSRPSDHYMKNYYSTIITYQEFEKEGFSKDLTKRITEKLVDLNKIKKRMSLGGFDYSINEVEELVRQIKFSRKAVSYTGVLEYDSTEDWIYDHFFDEELNDLFEHIKQKYLKGNTYGNI